MNESVDKLNNLWHKWNSHSILSQDMRFGQYVFSECKLNCANPAIFYEKSGKQAYTMLYSEITSGQLEL